MGKAQWKGIIEAGIRKHEGPRGQRWYRVQLGGRGKGNRRSRVCATLSEALVLKQQWLAGGLPQRGAEGTPLPEEPGDGTVEDALRLWTLAQRVVIDPATDRPSKSGRDGRAATSVVRRIWPELLGLPVTTLAPDHFAIFRDRYIEQGGKPGGAATYMGMLRAAVRRLNPAFSVPRGVFPHEDLTRHAILEPHDVKRALLALEEPFRTMAHVAALTLMRLSEIRLLTRDALDFVAGTIRLKRAKKGPRVVAMSQPVAGLLMAQLAQHDHAYVFPRDPRRAGRSVGKPYTQPYISEVWHEAMVRIGLGHVRFHDLRHHGAMVALASGASFPELQALGGWATPKMVNRYATASNGRLRDLQERIAGYHTASARRGR